MGTSKETRSETPPPAAEKSRPVTLKATSLPLSERIKPWLARPARRRRSGHYTIHDIEKALALAG